MGEDPHFGPRVASTHRRTLAMRSPASSHSSRAPACSSVASVCSVAPPGTSHLVFWSILVWPYICEWGREEVQVLQGQKVVRCSPDEQHTGPVKHDDACSNTVNGRVGGEVFWDREIILRQIQLRRDDERCGSTGRLRYCRGHRCPTVFTMRPRK